MANGTGRPAAGALPLGVRQSRTAENVKVKVKPPAPWQTCSAGSPRTGRSGSLRTHNWTTAATATGTGQARAREPSWP